MNPNKLNECLDIILENCPKENIEKTKKVCLKWKSASSFYMDMPECSASIADHPEEQLISDGRMCLPFQFVKLFDTAPDLHGRMHHYLFHHSDKTTVVMNIVQNESVTACSFLEMESKLLCEMVKSKDKIPCFGSFMLLKPKFEFLDFSVRDQWATHQENMNKFFEFVSIVNCPRHHVCRVSPSNTKGRSTQWIESKSHYIVLGPEHAKEVQAGSTRQFTGAITKSMHNRRAHFRRLTSERFTKKRGMKIWVNASWIGPEEWNDKFGNTYKISQKAKIP